MDEKKWGGVREEGQNERAEYSRNKRDMMNLFLMQMMGNQAHQGKAKSRMILVLIIAISLWKTYVCLI